MANWPCRTSAPAPSDNPQAEKNDPPSLSTLSSRADDGDRLYAGRDVASDRLGSDNKGTAGGRNASPDVPSLGQAPSAAPRVTMDPRGMRPQQQAIRSLLQIRIDAKENNYSQ
eukprot:361616-Chlamydomonas_euryale.AAC.11